MVRAFQRQMIVWTLILIVALGAVIGALMLQPPAPERKHAHSPAFARAQKRWLAKERQRAIAQIKDVETREPASTIPKETLASLASPAIGERLLDAVDVRFKCLEDNTTRVGKDVAQIRLSGSYCEKSQIEGEIISTEIRNDRNGFSATVFKSSSRSFTTDYISLASGDNKIRIVHLLKGGGKEEYEFLAHREP